MTNGSNRYAKLIEDILLSTKSFANNRTNMGQVETDEIYIGLDQRGAQYVFPIQAKGGADQLGIVQIEQDFALCSAKFSILICRSIAAQFIQDNLIALFCFETGENGHHYRNTTTR